MKPRLFPPKFTDLFQFPRSTWGTGGIWWVIIFFKRAAQPPTSSLCQKRPKNAKKGRSFLHHPPPGGNHHGFLTCQKIQPRTHEIQQLHPLEKPLGHFERWKNRLRSVGRKTTLRNFKKEQPFQPSNLEDKVPFPKPGSVGFVFRDGWNSNSSQGWRFGRLNVALQNCGWFLGWVVEGVMKKYTFRLISQDPSGPQKLRWKPRIENWKMMFAHPFHGPCVWVQC